MRPISVPHVGKPEMKLLVPSMGSSTQTYSDSGAWAPNSSPMIPCSGKSRMMRRRIAVSAARSASVTGSNTPPPDLSEAWIEERKNGRIASPETRARSSTKAEKSTGFIPPAFRYCADPRGAAR